MCIRLTLPLPLRGYFNISSRNLQGVHENEKCIDAESIFKTNLKSKRISKWINVFIFPSITKIH